MAHIRNWIVVATLAAAPFVSLAQPAMATSQPAAYPAQSVRNLTLKLPIGDIELLDANLQVLPGANNKLERFRGTARVKLPAVGLLADLKMPDLVRADIGLDTGAALSDLGAPLEKDRRYLFLDFGGGLNVSRNITDDVGAAQTISLSVPPGQRVVLVIDPETPLLFVLGSVNVSYTGDLAMIGNLLRAPGLNLSILDNVQLPGLSSIVISGTLAPGTGKSSVGVQASTGLDAGVLGAAMGVQAAPLTFRGGARLDASGVTVTGVTQSKVAPDVGWDGRAMVQLRVPFDGQQAFVDLTGALSAPLAQLQTMGEQRITIDGQALANTIESTAESAGGAVSAAAGGGVKAAATTVAQAGNTASNVVTTAVQAGGAAITAVQGAAGQVVGAAPTVVASAASAAGSGWQAIMQQVCKATRRC